MVDILCQAAPRGWSGLCIFSTMWSLRVWLFEFKEKMFSLICSHIFISLSQTTRLLKLRRNVVKLSLYQHFTNTLIFSVVGEQHLRWTVSEFYLRFKQPVRRCCHHRLKGWFLYLPALRLGWPLAGAFMRRFWFSHGLQTSKWSLLFTLCPQLRSYSSSGPPKSSSWSTARRSVCFLVSDVVLWFCVFLLTW